LRVFLPTMDLIVTNQTKKFLAQWESEHITVVARSDREDQARRLALQCREDAAKARISDEDLEAAVDGDLIGNMLQALDAESAGSMCDTPQAWHSNV
jgi:hypothetical protein